MFHRDYTPLCVAVVLNYSLKLNLKIFTVAFAVEK